MRLTILRHATAVDREDWDGDDADRPLTKRGAERCAEALDRCRPLVRAVEIWTSPWLRARQTAELAASAWKLPLREKAWLAGGAATPVEGMRRIDPAVDAVLVGHEPDLGVLIAYLVGARRPVALKKSGIAVLDGDARAGGMELRLLIAPKQVLAIADD